MAKKVIETYTGSRRIHGMSVATPKWTPSCVRFLEATKNTNLDVMDDSDELEKNDNQKEENNTVKTPAVTVTVTVDTSGPSPPPAKKENINRITKTIVDKGRRFS